MSFLQNYNQFYGRHWETGSIANTLAYQNATAPHTGKPYSEAMLLGVSGGVVLGYYTFAYEGHDPHVALLTRNTFDPWDTLLGRLGVVQDVRQTPNPERAHTKLLDALENGTPAIVWADMFLLPYNGLGYQDDNWAMLPIVVYGVEGETVHIADRAEVPLTVSLAEFQAARSRIKKDKHKLLTLSPPDPDKLAFAVSQGIHETIRFYTEGPPKGSKKNFGFLGFETIMDALSKPKHRISWEKEFPMGRKMFAGMTSMFSFMALYGQDGRAQDAERGMYADFLDEASVILERPGLKEAAEQFRGSAKLWRGLGEALLPDDVPVFKKTREMMVSKHRNFIETGKGEGKDGMKTDKELETIRTKMETDFPWDAAQVTAYREGMREQFEGVYRAEKQAVETLQGAMG